MNVSPILSIEDILDNYTSKKYALETVDYFKDILPLRPSTELAEIAADLMTDGHIAVRKYYNAKKYSYLGFFSDDDSELDRFKSRINKIFKINGHIKEWGFRKNGRSKGCIIIDARLARLLELCGIPGGDKVKKKYKIPEWIMKGNEEIKRSFLRRSFTCEGSIDREKNGRWEIRYTMYKLQSLSRNNISYLNSLRRLLRGFNIKTYNPSLNQEYVRDKDKQKVLGFVLRIRERQSLINYVSQIGFDTEEKKRRAVSMSNQIN